jgi:hypothetical protein
MPDTEFSAMGATTCQVVDVRSAITGNADVLAADWRTGCGPSGSRENSGDRAPAGCTESAT